MAMAEAETAVKLSVAAQTVANAFVEQYYNVLGRSPSLAHRFYQDISKLGRPEDDGSMGITTTMQAINDKIVSLNNGDVVIEIKSVDAQESLNGGVQVLVLGNLTGEDRLMRSFSQSFFLAPQEIGYFVLNDMFRYVENANHHDGDQLSSNEIEAPVTPDQSPPVQENQTEEANEEEECDLSENVEVSDKEEEVALAEVVAEVQDDSSNMVVESKTNVEQGPKKSFASIVMDLKKSGASFSSQAPVPQKSVAKSQEQQTKPSPTPEPVVQAPVSDPDTVENGNNHDGEAEGYSIYIKGLPADATPALLENEFKRFGPIKKGGIQVRGRQWFSFGFIEFEVADAVQKAIDASPLKINGRQAFVEEKKSTNSRGNNKGDRFPDGRGYRFRKEGRDNNYRGNREGGYYSHDFGNNNGGGRGGYSNRRERGDGYQRADKMGGSQMNRAGFNGSAKNMAPRVSATA